MKTLQEITTALSQEYTRETYNLAPIKDIDGMDYIPWNDSADLANRVFGPLGWSNTLVSCNFRQFTGEFWDRQQNAFVERTFQGYEAIVRVEVHYIDEQGEAQKAHRDGAGFADIVPQGRKNPLDLAFKAAASDAFSRAVKQLGDYFGLFLYDKPVEEEQSSPRQASGSTQRSGSTGGSNGGGSKGFPVSEGRVPHLLKLGYTQEQINGMNNNQAKTFFDLHWTQKVDAAEAAAKAGLPPLPEKSKSKDDLPIPAGARR